VKACKDGLRVFEISGEIVLGFGGSIAHVVDVGDEMWNEFGLRDGVYGFLFGGLGVLEAREEDVVYFGGWAVGTLSPSTWRFCMLSVREASSASGWVGFSAGFLLSVMAVVGGVNGLDKL
jgi:hypothetical protein